jgi:choloylglycine hydrolase
MGCTAMQIRCPATNSWVYGRTMEWDADFKSKSCRFPKGHEFNKSPVGHAAWKSRFAMVGMDTGIRPGYLVDGMNEMGLVVGSLYLRGDTTFQSEQDRYRKQQITSWELPVRILSSCQSIKEVRALLDRIRVVKGPLLEWKGNSVDTSTHYYIMQRDGESIDVEYIRGRCRIHLNRIGVLTNNPPWPQQVRHLKPYFHLKPGNDGKDAVGLPGDFTSPSRFVRAWFMKTFTNPGSTPKETVQQMIHAMHQFDIPRGVLGNKYTQWTVVYDLHSLAFMVISN